jgi:YspA, cpYpsA-related SLOG family
MAGPAVRRILVTGSREWTDWPKLCGAINDAASRGYPVTIVAGGAKGADKMAEQWAQWVQQVTLEVHLPDWNTVGRSAGFRRNQAMVDLGADVCLAFALTWDSGTGHCARAARKAGIETIDYGVDTRLDARPR